MMSIVISEHIRKVIYIMLNIYDAEAYGNFHPNNYALFFHVAKSLL